MPVHIRQDTAVLQIAEPAELPVGRLTVNQLRKLTVIHCIAVSVPRRTVAAVATAPAFKRLQIAVSAELPVGHTLPVATQATRLAVSVPRRTAVLKTLVKINLL